MGPHLPMRTPHEQAATHGGRFCPRYESQTAAQHPRHRAQNQRRADSRSGRRVARKPSADCVAGFHCGGQQQPQPAAFRLRSAASSLNRLLRELHRDFTDADLDDAVRLGHCGG